METIVITCRKHINHRQYGSHTHTHIAYANLYKSNECLETFEHLALEMNTVIFT